MRPVPRIGAPGTVGLTLRMRKAAPHAEREAYDREPSSPAGESGCVGFAGLSPGEFRRRNGHLTWFRQAPTMGQTGKGELSPGRLLLTPRCPVYLLRQRLQFSFLPCSCSPAVAGC